MENDFKQITDKLTHKLNGKPLYEQVEDNKHNIDFMLSACIAIEIEAIQFKPDKYIEIFIPAPYYFERAALLANKKKDYELVIKICHRWLMLEDRFHKDLEYIKRTVDSDFRCADVTKGSSAIKIHERLAKAELKLKQLQERMRK